MKISLLRISNFLKLKDVEINPSHTNVITGKNKQGKTSILRAIQAAMGGKVDESAIRTGEDKAEITIELDDLIVHRTVTGKGTYLDVTNREGMKMPKPQQYLDGLVGTFSFNPVEFFNLKPADQRKYLLEAVPMRITPELIESVTGEKGFAVDWEEHALNVVAAIRKVFYDRRTVANAEVTKKRKVLEDLSAKVPSGFDASKFSEEGITALREAIRKDELALEKVKANDQLIASLMHDDEDVGNEIARLQKKQETIKAKLAEANATVIDHSDEMTLSAARETLANLESQRENVFTVRRAIEVRKELDESVTAADRLDAIVGKLTKDVPESLLASAKMPVEGLTVAEDGLAVNGIPLEHLSASEQIRVSLDVVRAMNARFKVILIDGIEALDKENFDAFLKEIEGDDYQYFLTRVDGSGPGSIVIEDGGVKK